MFSKIMGNITRLLGTLGMYVQTTKRVSLVKEPISLDAIMIERRMYQLNNIVIKESNNFLRNDTTYLPIFDSSQLLWALAVTQQMDLGCLFFFLLNSIWIRNGPYDIYRQKSVDEVGI